MIVGRSGELNQLRDLLESARAGNGGAVVLSGEAGVGKTALLDALVAGITDARVLRTRGNEAESPLAFAALHRLLIPLLPQLPSLPAPQARALSVIFGLTAPQSGIEDDRFLVFLGVLSLLTDAAKDAPVVCVVDDAHWLDDASAAALLFVARRVEHERVAVIFAARDGDTRRFEAGDLPALELEGLAGSAAHELLQASSAAPLPREVRDRLIERTHGNPLALIEIPSALSTEQLEGEAPLPTRLPLTDNLERVFLDRAAELSDEARLVLLVAAADDLSDLETVRRAASTLGSGDTALRDAIRSGLVHTDGTLIELRHPLVRSAIYAAASPFDRQGAHAALAEALSVAHPDRALWHRAAAASGLDADIARELDALGTRSTAQGGHEAASAAWERAAELSPAEEDKAVRYFRAAAAAWRAGQATRTRSLAQTARALTGDAVLLADIDRLRAFVEMNHGAAQVAHGILLRAAGDIEPTDVERAVQLAMIGTALATFGFDSGLRVDVDALVAGIPRAEESATRALLAGLSSWHQGDRHEAAQAIRPILSGTAPPSPDLITNVGIAAIHLGDDVEGLRWHDIQLAEARAASSPTHILHALTRRSVIQLALGRWADVRAAAHETLELAKATGQLNQRALPLAELAVLDCLQGREDPAASIARAETAAEAQSLGVLEVLVDDLLAWARALATDPTDPRGAHHHLQRIRHEWIGHLAIVDRLQGASRAEDPESVTRIAGEFTEFADATGSAWAEAAAAFGRALLAKEGASEQHYEAAKAAAARSTRPFDRARIQLAYGSFLRRARRRVDARTELRDALATFDDLGALPWSARAAEELRASGEALRKKDQGGTPHLTAQELQVALLVQQGLANKDVAARLFVSPRTVDFHLRNVFAKLGIASRGALSQIDLNTAV